VENTLPKLQKVGYELAANSGHRSCGIARALHALEVSDMKTRLQDGPNFEFLIKGTN